MATVTAQIKKDVEGVSNDPVTVDYDFGDDLEQVIEKFGVDVVFSRVRASLVIDLQAYIRRMIAAQKSPDEIQDAVNTWKPGVKAAAKSPVDKAKSILDGLSPEEREELLASLG